MTGEPFQPVRLYYSLPKKAATTRIFLALRCVVEAESGGWLWHYDEEAAALKFSRPRQELPEEVHPIILGRFRFPSKDRMVLEVRSGERAIEAAKFFGPMFGPTVVLRRLRMINRFFEASEAAVGLDRLDKLLDANVVCIDPTVTEAAIEAALAGAKTQEEKQRAYFSYCEERRKIDVPLVEDLPLHPEEETTDFRDLGMTLRFRGLRAFEHWKGNTHLTLAEVIHRVVEDGGRGLTVGPPG